MRYLASILAACGALLVLGTAASPAQAANCRDIHAGGITAKDVTTGPGLGCRGARPAIKEYFDLVLASAQSPGGCAQERFSEGCQVAGFRCYSRYNYSTNQLQGVCKGRKGKVRFREFNAGSG